MLSRPLALPWETPNPLSVGAPAPANAVVAAPQISKSATPTAEKSLKLSIDYLRTSNYSFNKSSFELVMTAYGIYGIEARDEHLA
jgi:hypothetical protein